MAPEIVRQAGDILLIHPGGLGDVCISESTFMSLKRHFGPHIIALGNSRVLEQFEEYFERIESIGSRRWSYLFSESVEGPRWPAIVLIGKDRSGTLRQGLLEIADRLVFIRMYPDNEIFPGEQYQLEQLPGYGITAYPCSIPLRPVRRVILYPEKSITKAKWPLERFLEIWEELKKKGVDTLLVRQRGVDIPHADIDMPDSLYGVANLFGTGGIFLSNDSGMAHFAARCGLRAVTFFHDTNPAVWKPKNGVALTFEGRSSDMNRVVKTVLSLMD
jgi:ADP-heptose:LPS heptosyltransferase